MRCTMSDHTEEIPNLIEDTARRVVESRPIASMARITDLSRDNRRATIELLNDPGTKANNVPIAVPFADGSSGDVLPIEPGAKGIALVLDHAVDEQLASDGDVDTTTDGMEVEDSIFLPAMITKDEEQWPSHTSGDRVWEHPSGSRIEMDDGGAVTITHENGAKFEVGGEIDDTEPIGFQPDKGENVHPSNAISGMEADHHGGNAYKDNETWPVGNDGETYDQMSHPEGPHTTITHRGVSVGADIDEGPREVISGQNNDPERSELDGHHQHFHVKQNADGSADLVGPQLSFREFLAWMVDDERQAQLNNADQYAQARLYAENYLLWLEQEVGRSLDPTNPEEWPDAEPMPTPQEREWFENDPVIGGQMTYTASGTLEMGTPTVGITSSVTMSAGGSMLFVEGFGVDSFGENFGSYTGEPADPDGFGLDPFGENFGSSTS